MNAPSIAHSPYLPTQLESLLLLIYPSTLLLGSLFSLVSPQTRLAPYDAAAQSHPPALAPSYFAHKRNVFNVYFVKIGWFWTTLAFALFLLSHPSLGPRAQPWVVTPRRLRGLARWALATLWWGAVTQWFFGPPLIDRGFSLTGGVCEVLEDSGRVQGSKGGRIVTHAACKAVGGKWFGGHDISGHVFMLILGSGMLWFEILPVLLRNLRGLRGERIVKAADGTVGKVKEIEMKATGPGASNEKDEGGLEIAPGWAVKFALGVAGLSWWMLLMTAAYFHTWFEKFTGLIVAFLGLWTIYFLPRAVPVLRQVLGMPAV